MTSQDLVLDSLNTELPESPAYVFARMKQMTSCVFCKIVAGQLESSKVYEDDEVLAFMDIQPVRQGQVLVIPKRHIDHFSDIPDALALRIYLKAHALLKTVRKVVHPERMGLVIHGYGVPHAHVIIVPQYHEDDITSGRMANVENGRVVFTIKNLPEFRVRNLIRWRNLSRTAANTFRHL